MTAPAPVRRGAYYNEIDPFAAQWLRNLISKNLIAPGDVDERSIVDVRPDDLKGYVQCHFFAGIGGWSLAARLAGFPDDRELWTGSCPCQPFSRNGARKGASDERHLWPAFFHLIQYRRPTVVFGEQVAGVDGLEWLDGVHSDLDSIGYACGATVIPAFGVGAPHKRDRIYFVADTQSCGWSRQDIPTKEWMPPNRASKNYWRNCRTIEGHDGARRIEPGIEPVADGVPARVGKLRAYGNAIVPQVAAEIIAAYTDTIQPAAERAAIEV